MKCEHILIATDFSPDSERALTAALGLAQTFAARLTLVYAVDVREEFSEVNATAYLRAMESVVHRELEARRSRAQEAGIAAEALVVHGAPAQRIVQTADSQQADLIVMGTRGRTGVQRMLIGSVAERVLRAATCPVLVVPAEGEPGDAP